MALLRTDAVVQLKVLVLILIQSQRQVLHIRSCSSQLHVSSSPPPPDCSKMASALLLTTLVLSSATRATRAESMQKTIDFQSCPEFNSKIEGITGVQGVPFECATLLVPLDYTNTDSESLKLDLFRVKATEEPVLGSVLINFGGMEQHRSEAYTFISVIDITCCRSWRYR